jgi:NitT/TauT family transport system substrate-binding protein
MKNVFSLACGLVFSLAAVSTSQAADDVVYQMSWIPSGDYAPLSAGIEKGFFKEAGINLTLNTGRGSGDAVTKIAAGVASFGDGNISSVMSAKVSSNAPTKCLMSLQTKSPHALFVMEGGPIKSFKDLPGKTLGTTPGNSHFGFFPAVAKLAGIDASTINWVSMEPGSLAPTLIAGKIDGATLFALNWYYQNKAAEKQGKRIKVLPFTDAGFNIYAYCIIANENFVAKNPDLTRRLISALQKSYIWSRDNIQEAAVLHKKRYPELELDDIEGTMKMMFPYIFNEVTERDGFGKFNSTQLKATYDAVAAAEKLKPDADVNQFIDTSLLPK